MRTATALVNLWDKNNTNINKLITLYFKEESAKVQNTTQHM